MEGNRHWYVIHTYSGYENKVCVNLERKIHSLGMEDMIFQCLVPMQNEIDIKDDKKKVVERKVFPGYVLVEMIVDDRTWYAVRNTPGVTGFVGSGNKPIPLTDSEVERILGALPKHPGDTTERVHMECPVKLNQTVRIKAPGFEGSIGTVATINDERQKVKVLVNMFGRETPVEVDYTQVEEVQQIETYN